MREPPNILLITTDQQRYDAIAGYGPSWLRTPHLDLLRREGVTFSRAYSECPLCVPARVGILSGQSPARHLHTTNAPTTRTLGRTRTLPSVMRGLGYQTAAIGKMHFGPERARHGFDEMILPADYYEEMSRRGYDCQPMRHGLGQNELYPGLATVPESLTLSSWIAEESLQYIRNRRDPTIPFFLWTSFSKPHPPLDPPEPYYSMYRNCEIPGPVYGDWCGDQDAPPAFVRARQVESYDQVPEPVIREARAAYYGLVTQVDYHLGRLFAGLMETGQFGNTLILFCSDHGEYLGDHRAGAKTFWHDVSARVPMILRMPKGWDNRQHGTTCNSLVSLADILPTFTRAAGGEGPGWSDGVDLVATARAETEPRPYLEGHFESEFTAITDGRWKYIYYPEGPAEQLFDLEKDPLELHDLARQGGHPEGERLRGELLRRHRERGSHFLSGDGLISFPVRRDSEADRRNQSWRGFCTEFHTKDTRH